MVGVTVSALMAIMNPVLGKLATLLEREYARLKGVRQQTAFLLDELSSMTTALQMQSELEEPNPQAKEWMNQLRELSYDIDDCFEILMTQLGRADTCDGFFNKIITKLITLKARYHIGHQIHELKERVLEVSDRQKRYKLDPSASGPKSVVIDPRLPSLFEEADRLVGIDTKMDELAKMLVDGIGCHSQRKVVSIVGFGGLGKTTLANQVLQKVKGQFDCTAFVSVSRTPNVNKIIADTHFQILKSRRPTTEDRNQDIARMQKGSYVRTLDYLHLVNMNRDYLQNKRYLVIIDDVWSKQAWEEIQCAFPHNNNASRIITTTRIEDVAKFCSFPHTEYVYPMRPLDNDQSKILFLKRIFDDKDDCPVELKEVTGDILRKCHGLPLAIVNIASQLATKPTSKHEWERLRNSLVSALDQDHHLEVVKRILFLSYYDLPHHLKACFLDLSIFPEDQKIGRSRLIRRWMAEGFIVEQPGKCLVDTAECCIDELINRNMIEPVETDFNGKPRACRVHDMMLDLIVSLSIQENFATIVGDGKLTPSTNKIRRLSLQGNMEKQNFWLMGSKILSHVRSFSVFGDAKKVPPLLHFQVLRVLDLQDYSNLEDSDIRNIGNLIHLRYVSLYNSNISKIPIQIGNLKYLQTLDLRYTRIKELPATVAQLQQLVHLFVPAGVRFPNGICKMGALEEVSLLDCSINSPHVVQELGNLTNIKVIGIRWCADGAINDEGSFKKSLISSLCKLGERKLQSLRIETMEHCYMDFLVDSWCPPPRHMRTLSIGPILSTLPKWISYLSELTDLSIYIEEVDGRDVNILKDLNALRCLQIFTAKHPQESLIISPSGFQRLEDFHFRPSMHWRNSKGMLSLKFEAGAMPRLNNLWFRFVVQDTLSAYGVGFDFGISHLSSLKRLWVSINCRGARVCDVEAAKTTIKSAASLLPNSPRHEIHIFGAEEMMKQEQAEGTSGSKEELVSEELHGKDRMRS